MGDDDEVFPEKAKTAVGDKAGDEFATRQTEPREPREIMADLCLFLLLGVVLVMFAVSCAAPCCMPSSSWRMERNVRSRAGRVRGAEAGGEERTDVHRADIESS